MEKSLHDLAKDSGGEQAEGTLICTLPGLIPPRCTMPRVKPE